MPAMIYQAQRTARAGEDVGRAVMKDADGNHVELWSQAEMHELVGEQADIVANLESARNVIEKRLADIAAPWFDDKGGLDDAATEAEIRAARWASYVAATDFVKHETIDAATMAEAAKLAASAGGLPAGAGIERVRTILIERLEARAMARVKYFKGALTQQAIDNWAACVDMDNALHEVAKQCILASINISRAMEEYAAWKKVAAHGLGKAQACRIPTSTRATTNPIPASATTTTGIGSARATLRNITNLAGEYHPM